MAQKIIHVLTSDLSQAEHNPDEGVRIETVEFGLDKSGFEMELTEAEATKLRETLAPFIAAARKTGGTRTRGKATTAATRQAVTNAAAANKAPTTGGTAPGKRSREETAAIREWAKGAGFEVSSRGRIPTEVEEAYEKAHKGRQTGGVPKSNGASLADAPDVDTAPETDGEGTEELSGWQEPTRPLSAVPSLPEGDDPADQAAPTQEKNGPDGVTPTRREAIRAWAKKQGMEVRDKGILKKDTITQAIAWENAHGSLDVAAAESRDDKGDGLDELRSMLP